MAIDIDPKERIPALLAERENIMLRHVDNPKVRYRRVVAIDEQLKALGHRTRDLEPNEPPSARAEALEYLTKLQTLGVKIEGANLDNLVDSTSASVS